jgi:hypothetical protein
MTELCAFMSENQHNGMDKHQVDFQSLRITFRATDNAFVLRSLQNLTSVSFFSTTCMISNNSWDVITYSLVKY